MMRKMWLAVLAGCLCVGLARAETETPIEGTMGEITGTITAKEDGKITVKNEEGELKLMPHWRGGKPKDGGGYDQDMLAKLEQFKVGDKVKINWVFIEHYRIETIEHAQ